MKKGQINKIYIGGWFQRTIVHLSEINEYLRTGTSPLRLNKAKLKKLHKSLNIAEFKYLKSNLDKITLKTKNDLKIIIFEDGLVVLEKNLVQV